MQALQLAALQMDLIWQDPTQNRLNAERMLSQLKQKVDLILLPEMFTTGFSMDASQHCERMEGETEQWMEKMAQKYTAVIAGSIIVQEDLNYFNRMLIVGPNGLLAEYDKRHLFRMAGEHEVYTQGTDWVWFEWKGWRIAPQICYDLRFPVWSRNQADGTGKMKYDLLLYLANWPAKRIRHWDTLLKARAIENQAYVAGVNRVGEDGNELPYNGHSAILDYMGDPLAGPSEKEEILYASLDPEPLERYRTKFPVWRDADQFDLYP
ncbi:MAG: amidohydrolase [Bacteroidota bacterium]